LRVAYAKMSYRRNCLDSALSDDPNSPRPILAPALAEGKPAPYDAKTDRVIESRLHSLGEIGDLKPGARGKLTVNLKPGSYLLFCNEPGHYKAGMSTSIEVEK
jgi:uncharacterized cupredoxin-like copper-binding protein